MTWLGWRRLVYFLPDSWQKSVKVEIVTTAMMSNNDDKYTNTGEHLDESLLPLAARSKCKSALDVSELTWASSQASLRACPCSWVRSCVFSKSRNESFRNSFFNRIRVEFKEYLNTIMCYIFIFLLFLIINLALRDLNFPPVYELFMFGENN